MPSLTDTAIRHALKRVELSQKQENLADGEGRGRAGRPADQVAFLQGAQEILADEAAHLGGLPVIGVVVAGREHVGADQDAAAHLAAELLSRYHYKAVPLDDAMSKKIFDRYLKTLDPEKLVFVKSDIEQRIIDNGVAESSFTLNIVPNDQADQPDSLVVGHCANDTHKILYTRTNSGNAPANSSPAQDGHVAEPQ